MNHRSAFLPTSAALACVLLASLVETSVCQGQPPISPQAETQPGGAAPGPANPFQSGGPGAEPESGLAPSSAESSAAPPAQQQALSDSEVVDLFKLEVPEEVRDAGLASLEVFDARASELKELVLAMRRQYVLLVNGYSEDRESYFDLRNLSRAKINETYTASLDVLNYMPYPSAAKFIVTVLNFRVEHDVYDEETLEGANKLQTMRVPRYVAFAAARSAMLTGDFEIAQRIYENLDDEELENKDRAMIAQFDLIKSQFEQEQEQLKQDPEDLPKVRVRTTRGDFVAELYIDQAPSTVAHFINLVESNFYDDLDFFQVVSGLLALTGDPLGDGSTKPDRFVADEHNRADARMPLAGSLVMAKIPLGNGEYLKNSAGTQFAVLYMPNPVVVQQQTVFGRVIEGMDVVCALRRVDPHKEKKKTDVVVPPDRILGCEILNRPETLPEVQYATPSVR